MSREAELVAEYHKKVERLVEVDYGDFKRKLGQYINCLLDHLGAKFRNREILEELKAEVDYLGPANVDWARHRTLDALAQLKV